MAIDYYQNLTPQERLDKITQIINKGICRFKLSEILNFLETKKT